jgi:serine/threonine-protein kinase
VEADPTLLDPAPPLDSAPETQTSFLAGRYELLALVGSGGMGNVYRAHDHELDEVVALKLVRPQLGEAVARFRQEVRLARRVTHPNVARTFDIGVDRHRKFLTMEFVDGDSLRGSFMRSAPSPERMRELVLAVCAGLEAAHAAGVVHRDLKPDNILVARDGTPKITDFGLAQAIVEAVPRVAGIVGTPAYMAPEQVEGAERIDGACDVYALGVMLFELFTGRQPWTGANPITVACARLLAPPPDPRDARPDLSADLALLILRCMAREPGARPAVAEIAQALRASPSLALDRGAPETRRAIAPSFFESSSRALVVVPLRNDGDPADDHLASGLTDEITDALSATPGIRVAARGLVRGALATGGDPRSLARELGAHVCLEGTFRRWGQRVRVTARLTGVDDGMHLWSQRFERSHDDLLALADDVSGATATALAASVRIRRRGATDPNTVDVYLRARGASLEFWGGATARAVQLFERALEAAPDDPHVLAGYATALMRDLAFNPAPTHTESDALAIAERSVEVAPHLAETHVARAHLLFAVGRDPEGVASAGRALAVAPLHAEAHWLLGRSYGEVGRTTEAVEHMRVAYRLDPSIYHACQGLARTYALLGRWDEADAVLRADWTKENAGHHSAMSVRLASWRRDRAEELAREIRGFAPSEFELHLRMLETGKASEELIAHIRGYGRGGGDAVRRRTFIHQLTTEALLFSRETSRGLDELTTCAEIGLVDVCWLDHCPLFDGVRDDARFGAARELAAARAARVLEALEQLG